MGWIGKRRRQTMTRHENQQQTRSKDDSKIKSAKIELIKSPINMMLRQSFFLAIFGIVCRTVFASMSLPDGIENILGFVPSSSFKCERDGYFGDIDNDCRLFHLCQKQISSNGKVEWRHWTYACGNQTMFNQLTLTCAFVDEAIPCRHASQFQYLNEVIHKPREPFLTDADVTSGISYYTNRIMSDGARNRAFEDSNLMAQLGGGNQPPQQQQQQQQQQQSFFASNNQRFLQNDQRFVPTAQSNHHTQTIHFQQQNSNLNLNSQQPPQQRQQQRLQREQQGLFFPSNNNQLSADAEDSSSRTINSIELPDLPPLTATFQSLSRQATAPIADDSDRQSGRQRDLVLINHSAHHHQQRRQQEQQQHQPQLQFFAFPAARFAQPAPEPVSPPPAPVTVLPAISGRDSSSGQQNQQQLNVQQQPNPLASFNFAVSTDHQLGPSTSAHSTLFTGSEFKQQQQPQRNHLNSFQTTAPTLTTSAQATQVPSLPTVPTTASFTATTATAQPAATTITTTTAPTSTSTSQSRQAAEPFTTTTTSTTNTGFVAATTTTASSAIPATSRTAGTGARRASSGARSASNQQGGRRGAASAANKPTRDSPLLDAHPMRHFHSTRLSAMKQQQPQPLATESAVVMRRHVPITVTTPTVVASAAAAPASSSLFSGVPLSSIDESEALWRRPFDMQLMAPRFESFLTRRRV